MYLIILFCTKYLIASKLDRTSLETDHISQLHQIKYREDQILRNGITFKSKTGSKLGTKEKTKSTKNETKNQENQEENKKNSKAKLRS